METSNKPQNNPQLQHICWSHNLHVSLPLSLCTVESLFILLLPSVLLFAGCFVQGNFFFLNPDVRVVRGCLIMVNLHNSLN